MKKNKMMDVFKNLKNKEEREQLQWIKIDICLD